MERLEHPDIRSALITGYPRWMSHHDPRICPVCLEQPIDRESWELEGEEMCENCMIKIAKQTIASDPFEAAKFIGAVRRTEI